MKSENKNKEMLVHPAYKVAVDKMKDVISKSDYTIKKYYDNFIENKVDDYQLQRAKGFTWSVFKTTLYTYRVTTRGLATAVAEGDTNHLYSIKDMDSEFLTSAYSDEDNAFIYSEEGIQIIKNLVNLKRGFSVNDLRNIMNQETLVNLFLDKTKDLSNAKNDNFYDTPDNQ